MKLISYLSGELTLMRTSKETFKKGLGKNNIERIGVKHFKGLTEREHIFVWISSDRPAEEVIIFLYNQKNI